MAGSFGTQLRQDAHNQARRAKAGSSNGCCRPARRRASAGGRALGGAQRGLRAVLSLDNRMSQASAAHLLAVRQDGATQLLGSWTLAAGGNLSRRGSSRGFA